MPIVLFLLQWFMVESALVPLICCFEKATNSYSWILIGLWGYKNNIEHKKSFSPVVVDYCRKIVILSNLCITGISMIDQNLSLCKIRWETISFFNHFTLAPFKKDVKKNRPTKQITFSRYKVGISILYIDFSREWNHLKDTTEGTIS